MPTHLTGIMVIDMVEMIIDMVEKLFKYFVEKIYAEVVSYNKLHRKTSDIELFDIKCRQFAIIWSIVGLFGGAVSFVLSRFVFQRSLQEFFLVDIIVAVIIAIPINNRLNKLGIYNKTIQIVDSMNSSDLKRYHRKAALVGSLRVVSVVFIVFVSCWLLTFI